MLLEPYVCDQRAFIPYFEQQYINLQKNVFFLYLSTASKENRPQHFYFS